MKAAIVIEAGKPPICGDFAAPVLFGGEQLIKVAASALSQLTRGRASGRHYSSSGKFPLIAGVDGVGRLADGRRVYFALPRSPYGGMAEQVVVPIANCVPVPDVLDDVKAAAIANPGMSSWVAFTERAKLLVGETVLVNGATGTSGSLAVQIAKYMGAKKVIATGRNAGVLESLKTLGADVVIPLTENQEALDEALKEQFASRVDVVADYLWGQSAERILFAGAEHGPQAVPIRFVQIGAISNSDIKLPGAILRSSAVHLMGSGIGSVPVAGLLKRVGELLQATIPGGFQIATTTYPLSQVEQAWSADGNKTRIVVTMGH